MVFFYRHTATCFWRLKLDQLESGPFSWLLAVVSLRLSREKDTCSSVCSPVGQVLVLLQRWAFCSGWIEKSYFWWIMNDISKYICNLWACHSGGARAYKLSSHWHRRVSIPERSYLSLPVLVFMETNSLREVERPAKRRVFFKFLLEIIQSFQYLHLFIFRIIVIIRYSISFERF